MNKFLIALALTTTLLLPHPVKAAVAAKDKAKPPASATEKETEQALLKLEQDWASAYVRKDIAALDKIEAKDFTITDPSGKMSTKAQDIADLKSGVATFESVTLEETAVRVYGKTAVVTGLSTIKGTYQKKDISGKYRFIDVFVKKKKKSEWKVVATQVTAITAAH